MRIFLHYYAELLGHQVIETALINTNELHFQRQFIDSLVQESIKDLIDIYATMQDNIFNPVATAQIDCARSLPVKTKAQASSQRRADSNTSKKKSSFAVPSASCTPDCLGSEASWDVNASVTSGVSSDRVDCCAGLNIPEKPPVLRRKSEFTVTHDQQLWNLYREAGGAYPSDKQFYKVYAYMPCKAKTVRHRMSKLIALHRGVTWYAIPCKAFGMLFLAKLLVQTTTRRYKNITKKSKRTIFCPRI